MLHCFQMLRFHEEASMALNRFLPHLSSYKRHIAKSESVMGLWMEVGQSRVVLKKRRETLSLEEILSGSNPLHTLYKKIRQVP